MIAVVQLVAPSAQAVDKATYIVENFAHFVNIALVAAPTAGSMADLAVPTEDTALLLSALTADPTVVETVVAQAVVATADTAQLLSDLAVPIVDLMVAQVVPTADTAQPLLAVNADH